MGGGGWLKDLTLTEVFFPVLFEPVEAVPLQNISSKMNEEKLERGNNLIKDTWTLGLLKVDLGPENSLLPLENA